jgi:hypothetical protein
LGGRLHREITARPSFVHWVTETLPVRGTRWIESTTGRIVRTVIVVGSDRFVTTFRVDETLGLNVPVEMRESCLMRSGPLTTVATYGRFRRFAVTTQEKLAP